MHTPVSPILTTTKSRSDQQGKADADHLQQGDIGRSEYPTNLEETMFNFFGMAGNYEARKIDRFDADWGFVSTASVSDGSQPYETGISHEKYKDGGVIVVEAYSTREAAQAGHNRWVKKMTAKNLPAKLVDCCNAEIGQFAAAIGGKEAFTYERADK